MDVKDGYLEEESNYFDHTSADGSVVDLVIAYYDYQEPVVHPKVSMLDEDGNPVPGVEITVTTGGKTYTAITDANGVAFGNIEYSSPIIVGYDLVFASNRFGAKRLYSIDIRDRAFAWNYWRQFKADAAKTGDNTATTPAPAPTPGSSGGCFISTIK